MPLAEQPTQPLRGHKTICLPCSPEQYEQCVNDPGVRQSLEQKVGLTALGPAWLLASSGLDHRFGHFVWASDNQIKAKPYGIGPSFTRTAVQWPKR